MVHGQTNEKKKDDPIHTLLSSETEYGGYGGISLRYLELHEQDGLLIGGGGVWVINHALGIGIWGHGFFNESFASRDSLLNDAYRLAGGYGGLLFEPVIASRFPVHISFPILVGAGGIAYIQDYQDTGDNTTPTITEDADAFFVLEPGIELELNLLKFFRFSLGAYYRYTSNVKLMSASDAPTQLTDSDLMKGFSYGVSLKFGKF